MDADARDTAAAERDEALPARNAAGVISDSAAPALHVAAATSDSAAPALLLHHPASLEHDMGPHPECPERIVAVERELESRGWLGFARELSRPAARGALERVHPPGYLDALERFAARGGGRIDPDTAMSEGSYRAALHAAGGALSLVERLAEGSARTGLSLHRPPGHHATATRAMGFCFINNVAVAARHALDELGLERVMVLDFDVHHGNGTNDIFHSSRQVLFVSIHQWPLYPGTGAASDVGSGEGVGYTVNLPVPPGSGDGEFCSLVEHVALPLGRLFAPRLILISAGYDAHADDPLASCAVTEAGYARMTRALVGLGAEVGAPVGAVLEGGYDLGALARSVAATCEVLASSGGGSGVGGQQSGGGAVAAGAPGADTDLARQARARLREHWPELEG
jgi:acetoin utilization deacetylase AcuC-like enzyme